MPLSLDAFFHVLSAAAALEPSDTAAIQELDWKKRTYRAKACLRPSDLGHDDCVILLSGEAVRASSHDRRGSQQIVSLHMAGEVLNLEAITRRELQHEIIFLTDTSVAIFSGTALATVLSQRSNLSAAISAYVIDEMIIAQQWMANSARIGAFERLAYFLCEYGARLQVRDGSEFNFTMPLKQSHLGSALGLTPVHVNRVLRVMRDNRLIECDKQDYKILNLTRLRYVAGFDPTRVVIRRVVRLA